MTGRGGGPDLDRIRHDAREAAKFVTDSLGTRVLEQDVPALIAEIERLRSELADANEAIVDWSAFAAKEATECDAYRAVVDAARAWRKERPLGVITATPSAAALVAAVDALPQPAGATCCDLHGRNCEPPSELCCRHCTEASHPEHADGSACSAPDLSRATPWCPQCGPGYRHGDEGCRHGAGEGAA